MEKNLFKAKVQYRLAKLGITQKEIATRMNITEPYLCYLLKGISDTQLAKSRREEILEIINELEDRCKPVEK